MNFLYKIEKKIGKYAIHNLTIVMIICFIIGYILQLMAPALYAKLLFDPYQIFAYKEIWRIFTWIFTVPTEFGILTFLMLYFQYIIGTSVENTVGSYLYNIYMFGGLFISTLGTLIFSGIQYFTTDVVKIEVLEARATMATFETTSEFIFSSMYVSYRMTYYLILSMFLLFAVVNSESTMLFMFILPIKAKYIAYMDLILLAYEFIKVDYFICRVAIVCGVLNFFIFYLILRKYKGRRGPSIKQMKRRKAYKKKVEQAEKIMPSGVTRHKCAICGKTEKDDYELEFRFCSKCKGNYEYCNQHLFTHEHVK